LGSELTGGGVYIFFLEHKISAQRRDVDKCRERRTSADKRRKDRNKCIRERERERERERKRGRERGREREREEERERDREEEKELIAPTSLLILALHLFSISLSLSLSLPLFCISFSSSLYFLYLILPFLSFLSYPSESPVRCSPLRYAPSLATSIRLGLINLPKTYTVTHLVQFKCHEEKMFVNIARTS
jgi:hypothetical protein